MQIMPVLTLLTLIILPWGMAQAFDLFDPERGKEKTVTPPPVAKPNANKPVPPPPPPPKKVRFKPQQDFTIRGISRIGKKYAVVLQGPDKKQFIEYWQPGDAARPLQKYAEHKLLRVSAREVKIGYPSQAPCQTDKQDKGLDCSEDGNTALIQLVQLQAIAAPKPPPPTQPSENRPVNPFEAALQKQREQQANQAQAQQPQNQQQRPAFQPRRIQPEDVPPGMRVVRTPFGDRLVPENNAQPVRRSDVTGQQR